MARRKSLHATGGTIFSGRIVCGECGQIYGSKVWHSTDKYRRVVWRCNDKFNGGTKCGTPTLSEEQVKEAFERLLVKLAIDKKERIRNLREVQKEVGDVRTLEREKAAILVERDAISEMVRQSIHQNATVAQDQEKYNRHYDELALKDAALAEKIGELDKAIVEKRHNAECIGVFISSLMKSAEVFSEELWCTMVERVTVHTDGKMIFTLTCGTDIEV